MSDPNNKWNQPAAPPAPMFFGKKERDLVKQVNDELAERVIGQTIAYYPISIEESNFNETYGEAIDKVSLPPVRVFAYVEVENIQTNDRYSYEYQSKLVVNFHRKRLVGDQNLFVRVGDFVQYGDIFYEIVRTYNDTRYYFGQVQHKFQITADCIRARDGVFKVMPAIDRPTKVTRKTQPSSPAPAPRTAPYPPLAATYITVNSSPKLPNERVLTAGSGITLTDGGPNSSLTIAAAGANAVGPTGSIQYQSGGGIFTGSSDLTFLGATNRLGIGAPNPSHTLTISGSLSASADAFIAGNLVVNGTVLGASPLKVRSSIDITNDAGAIIASLGSSSIGTNAVSASLGVITRITASSFISSSYFYGSGQYLTDITASATSVAEGPVGALQFRQNAGGEVTGSSKIVYDTSDDRLTLNTGIVYKRTAVTANYTASITDNILGVTSVPVQILFDATSFSTGQAVVVKDETGTASTGSLITLNASASQTIDGVSQVVIESPHGAVLLYSNGSHWFIY